MLITCFDIETYSNFFCFVAKDYTDDGTLQNTYRIVNKSDNVIDDEIMRDIDCILNRKGEIEQYIISFNGKGFDLQVLAKMQRDINRLGSTTTMYVHNDAQEIIQYDNHNNHATRRRPIVNYSWSNHHFDMLHCCLLNKSLKQWEMYNNMDIRELPYNPLKPLENEQAMKDVLEYCEYDVTALAKIFFDFGYKKGKYGKPTLFAYRELVNMLPENLRDRFDRSTAQLGVGVIYQTLQPIPPKTNNPFKLFDINMFDVPDNLKTMFALIDSASPEELKENKYVYNGITYGKGGAHLCKPGIHFNIVNYDVASMYPSIVINWNLLKTPDAIVRYNNLKQQRLSTKGNAELEYRDHAYKLALNAPTGLFRASMSYLPSFDPAAGDAMCYIGQLILSEIILKIPSELLYEVNTDGFMCDNSMGGIDDIVNTTAARSGLVFEKDTIDIVYMRDVNNYCVYDKTGKFIKGKGDRWSDAINKNHNLAVTKELFRNLVLDKIELNWKQYEWTDFLYKYHRSAASKYAMINNEFMWNKNYYFLWTKRNCPNSSVVSFSRDLINKKNGSIKTRWGVHAFSINDLYQYRDYIDYEQYQRDLDDDFELWGREDLCTTRIPKQQRRQIKSLADIVPFERL